nr:hypothetical protein [Tanacetum cinerariifolium]
MLTQAAVAEGEDSGTPTELQLTASPTQPSTCGSAGDQVNLPYDSALSGGHTSDRAKGSLNLEALYALCTNLSNRILALETIKDAQAKEILTLKAKIKKLEKRWRQRTVGTARPDDDTARPDVSTARQELSTADLTTTPTTSTIFDDEEMTLANTLIKLKDDKAKGVAFKDSESTDRPARSILTLKRLLTIDQKTKGKIARDEEIARQLEVELQAEVERERQREEQASMDYIENLYDEVQARIDADHELSVRWTHFVPFGSKEDERMIRDMNKKAEKESSDKDLDEKGVIDYEVLDKRFPIINWESKFYHYDRHGAKVIYYRIFRSDGSSRWIKTFSEMVARFDRLDLVELYNLVMQRFESTTPEDGIEIHMLSERRYPLTTKTLERMLSLRLIVESASDAAYDLLRFIQKQIDESGGHDRGEKDL